MEIKDLQALYARHPKVKALAKALANEKKHTVSVAGLQASSAALAFASLPDMSSPLLFILDDMEEAGYFYHDLVQILGEQQVLFFPSSYRRAVKFGQRDAANEILRTEVIARTLSPLPREGESLPSITDVDGETMPLLFDVLRPGVPSTVLIGPEGDFSIEEVRLAMEHGYKSVTLGRSRLRTETAALVAVHMMQLKNAL